jgi:hypothetical protein
VSGFFDSIMNQLSTPMVAGGALGLAGGVAGALIPELTGANDFNVPKPDYGNIVIDQNEARSMIQGDMDALNNASGLEMTRIDASRGPAGAKLAAKQGAAAQIAGKRGQIAGKVHEQVAESKRFYEQAMQQYNMAKQQHENRNAGLFANSIMGGIGSLSQGLIMSGIAG